MYERDAADTTTTTRILLADPVANADFMFFGSSSYDGNGNVYLFGRNLDGANGTRLVHYRKWTRATTTLGAKVTVDATGNDNPWFSTKRGYSNARIEWIYTDGTASPFSVTYDAILLNTAPNAPVLVAPADASTENLAAGFTFDWTFSDPDAGDTQSAYAFRRKIVGAPSYEYWNAGTGLWQGTEVWNTGVGSEVTFAAGKWTNATSYQWSVATKDAAGVAGPYATDRTVTASQPAIVTVTAPSGTVTSSSRPPVTWSVSDPDGDAQETYQVKIESGAYGTTPGAGTAVLDSGEVSSVTARAWTPTADLTNGVTYRVFVRVKTAGQYSAWASTTFTLSLSPPAVPTFTLTDDPANGRVVVAVQGVDNLLTANQASLETDTTGWAAVANCTIARSTLHAADGSASLELSSVAAGNMTADTSTGVNGFPVVAGRQYTARAQHRAGATARTARIYITWYTAAGATISTSAVGDVVSSAANFNAMGSTTVVAPANAAFAAIRVEILATAAAAEKHYVDKIGVVPGTSTAWTRGGLAGSTRFTVERSDNAGVTFAAVRSGKEIAHDGAGSQAATVYDYEAAPFKAAQYRAKTTVEV